MNDEKKLNDEAVKDLSGGTDWRQYEADLKATEV